MSSPLGSPPVGNDRSDIATNNGSKIGSTIPKERRTPSSAVDSLFQQEQMKRKLVQLGSNGVESVRIWKARSFIESHSGEELSLELVAKQASTSRNYFSEKFKEATGTNFVEYVARTRYEKARAMLRDANLRVSEIGFAVGFQSLSQFNRVFKRLSGKSPTEYRAAPGTQKKTSR